MGDDDFAVTCQDLLYEGAPWTDAELCNGKNYEQKVLPPECAESTAEGLRIRYPGDSPDLGADDLKHPGLQIGPGCTSDQVVGYAMSLLGGLDDRLDPHHVRPALRAVVARNHRDEFFTHVNHLRSYARR